MKHIKLFEEWNPFNTSVKKRKKFYGTKDLSKPEENVDDIIDPFGEDNWDEKELEDLTLYLSEEQDPVYADGRPFPRDWKEKYYVVFEKDGDYYNLGEYRFGNDVTHPDWVDKYPEGFKMFYADTRGIESENLKKYVGGVSRELTTWEKEQVLDILSKGIKFTRNLMDDENGKSYTQILFNLIN